MSVLLSLKWFMIFVYMFHLARCHCSAGWVASLVIAVQLGCHRGFIYNLYCPVRHFDFAVVPSEHCKLATPDPEEVLDF